HPCPVLQGGDFSKAKSTYDRCIELMASVPGNRPVAFRTPCCDSLNTPSPRLFTEIFNRRTPKGNFLEIDSSVFVVLTPNDPELPRDLVLEGGRERFRKYVPFKSFVNTIEDYPYPYVIDRLCWEFPCITPSDWQAQNIHKPNNPTTVEDMKAALDAVVIKQGVFNLVFHPHGWIRAEQIVELIDRAQKKHGKKVKFLTFKEALERINKNLLAGQSLRDKKGEDNGVRLLDIDNDRHMDVVIGNAALRQTRVWRPQAKQFHAAPFPEQILGGSNTPSILVTAVRFGIVQASGFASAFVPQDVTLTEYGFDGHRWKKVRTQRGWLDGAGGVGLDATVDGARLLDLDNDSICEWVIGNKRVAYETHAVCRWNAVASQWQQLPFRLRDGMALNSPLTHQSGLRLVDVDEDGHLDALFSDDKRSALYLFDSMKTGWSRKVFDVPRGDARAIPAFLRDDANDDTNNGAWFHSRSLWVQNEDTARLPDLVDRRSFNELLRDSESRAKTPDASLKSMRVRPGFTVELVAAEPLVMDPIAMDWGPDGKLWVVEMADYPLGIDGKGKPGGRVRFLEDTNGDGQYDKSRLFLDGLKYPTSVMAWRKGVLVTAAPELFYAEDTDGDGRADVRRTLFSGFTEGNPQHLFNGLVWGLDNWVYLANGDSGGRIQAANKSAAVELRGRDLRVKPDEGLLELQTGQTQFGRTRDDWGNWFGCSNP
ncbi:MAG: PVC-type heme-binding CxxCH protein, partial [Pirellulales bacterium]